MKRDYDYYIEAAGQAERVSNGLWRAINQCIRSVLETQQKKGTPLKKVPAILEFIAGEEHKGEPISVCNLRSAAQAIRAGKDMVLL